MPYKSEKIQIEGTKLDRRIKLTPEQKDWKETNNFGRNAEAGNNTTIKLNGEKL